MSAKKARAKKAPAAKATTEEANTVIFDKQTGEERMPDPGSILDPLPGEDLTKEEVDAHVEAEGPATAPDVDPMQQMMAMMSGITTQLNDISSRVLDLEQDTADVAADVMPEPEPDPADVEMKALLEKYPHLAANFGPAETAAPAKPKLQTQTLADGTVIKFAENPEEDPNYELVGEDDGRIRVYFVIPKRFVEWLHFSAEMQRKSPQWVLEEMVRKTWAKDPMRRAAGGSLPRDEFKKQYPKPAG